MKSLAAVSKIEYGYSDLEEAFPTVDPGHEPCGPFVIVQIRTPKHISRGGIIIPDDARETDHDNTQVAKVIKIGGGAFKRRDDLTPWPEGAWYKVGDFVRCPKYGGDRWSIPYERKLAERKVGNITQPAKTESGEAIFVMFKELDCRAKVTGNPLTIKAYL